MTPAALLKQGTGLPDLSLLFVAAVWGGSYAIAKDALTTTSVAALIFLRFLIA